MIPAIKCKTCIKVTPIKKEVETVLLSPVQYKPDAFNSSNPTYCCQTNPNPRIKVAINKILEMSF